MQNYLLLVVLVTTQVLGDIWLSLGMKQFGVVSLSLDTIMPLLSHLFTSPWIWLAVFTLAFSMLIYLISVSRLDVSYVLPVHASSYVLNAILAKLILNEAVTPIRALATILITVGVLIVTWSDSPPSDKLLKQKNLKNSRNTLFFLLPFSLSLPKFWQLTLVIALADSAGDILTAKGMKQVGAINFSFLPSQILATIGKIITNPFMILGIGGYTTSFLAFISLLSWADISLVRPATAIGYIVSLLGARFILHEHIKPARWLGIVLIGFGVTVVSLT